MSEETDTLRVEVLADTGKAYRLRDCNDPERVDWFPASTVSFERRNMKTGQALAVISLSMLNKKDWNK